MPFGTPLPVLLDSRMRRYVHFRGLLDVKSIHMRDKKRTKEERDLHNLFKYAEQQLVTSIYVAGAAGTAGSAAPAGSSIPSPMAFALRISVTLDVPLLGLFLSFE